MAKRYRVLAASWGSGPVYARNTIVTVPRDADFMYDIATAMAHRWIEYVDGEEDAAGASSGGSGGGLTGWETDADVNLVSTMVGTNIVSLVGNPLNDEWDTEVAWVAKNADGHQFGQIVMAAEGITAYDGSMYIQMHGTGESGNYGVLTASAQRTTLSNPLNIDLKLEGSAGLVLRFIWDEGTSEARAGFFGATPVARPEIPATPTAQDIADVLVAFGLATQAA
jgi:hypothetical protein